VHKHVVATGYTALDEGVNVGEPRAGVGLRFDCVSERDV
jgi:hypothetical protein